MIPVGELARLVGVQIIRWQTPHIVRRVRGRDVPAGCGSEPVHFGARAERHVAPDGLAREVEAEAVEGGPEPATGTGVGPLGEKLRGREGPEAVVVCDEGEAGQHGGEGYGPQARVVADGGAGVRWFRGDGFDAAAVADRRGAGEVQEGILGGGGGKEGRKREESRDGESVAEGKIAQEETDFGKHGCWCLASTFPKSPAKQSMNVEDNNMTVGLLPHLNIF